MLIAVVAWAAASPLFGPSAEPSAAAPAALQNDHWRKMKEEALVAIKDAEFDHQLGKLSDDDYRELRRRLEAQALAAIAELER